MTHSRINSLTWTVPIDMGFFVGEFVLRFKLRLTRCEIPETLLIGQNVYSLGCISTRDRYPKDYQPCIQQADRVMCSDTWMVIAPNEGLEQPAEMSLKAGNSHC